MKPATLEVPARLYDSALKFVNARRKEKKLKPLKKLPAGRPHDPYSCPCAAKCGARIEVCPGDWSWAGEDKLHTRGVPTAFVKFFDKHSPKRHGPVLPIRKAKS